MGKWGVFCKHINNKVYKSVNNSIFSVGPTTLIGSYISSMKKCWTLIG